MNISPMTAHRTRSLSKGLAATFGFIVIGGCVPVATTYAHFDVEGAQYIHEPVFGAMSPPWEVYFPFHGIYVSFSLRFLYLGLHIPGGTEVQINDPTIYINSVNKAAPYEATFTIQAAPHKWSMAPQKFLALPDPFYTIDNVSGSLVGAGSQENLRWYLFVVIDPKDSRRLEGTPPGLTNGTVRLPSLTINGQRYDAQTISFTQKGFVGLACALC